MTEQQEANLRQLEIRFKEINQLLTKQKIMPEGQKVSELSKELSDLSHIVLTFKQFQVSRDKLLETKKLLEQRDLEEDFRNLAFSEATQLETEIGSLESRLRELLIKASLLDNRNAIVEIRAAAGGTESGLFASDLYRMYLRFAQNRGWKTEQLSLNEGGLGNIKEVIFRVEGMGVYGLLKRESGVHRVQRVPQTESSGRIHTSTSTVAVLPQVEESDLKIDPKDIKMDTFRSSGAGGQNVNKVETAVRLTHVPSSLTVTCQSERSQLQNRERAEAILRARLFELEETRKRQALSSERKERIGWGERAEKIRTYNFPQDRITDHRINKSFHNIQEILEGNLDPIVNSLKEYQVLSSKY